MNTPVLAQTSAPCSEQDHSPARALPKVARLFVFKEPISAGLVRASKKERYTSIALSPAYLERVLPLVNYQPKVLASVARSVSLHSKVLPGLTWSETVRTLTEQLLTAKHQRRQEQEQAILARAAAENNAAWGR